MAASPGSAERGQGAGEEGSGEGEEKLEDMPLLEFIRQTMELMVVAHSHTYSIPSRQTPAKARLAPMNLQAVRFDNGRHLIFKSDVHGAYKVYKKRTV
jgi:hypothetical protein